MPLIHKSITWGVAKPFPDPPVKTGLAGISIAMTAQMWFQFGYTFRKMWVMQTTPDPNHRSVEIFILSVIPDW